MCNPSLSTEMCAGNMPPKTQDEVVFMRSTNMSFQ